MADNIYSNIAIDMGGKHIGIASYTTYDIPTLDDVHAAILEMPNHGEGFNYTVKERTATRHRLRSQDRYVKARRLIFSILSSILKRTLTKEEKEAISSLMLRRGYTRLESEIDPTPIEECQSDYFRSICVECCPEFFPENDELSLYDRFISNCTKDRIVSFQKSLESNQIENKLSSIEEKEDRKTCEKVLKTMLEIISKFREEIEFGHKHRKEYLSNIRKDLSSDTRLTNIISQFTDSDCLYRCIGNISNLQLRALRWYFNDPSMNKESDFNVEKFKNIWIRAYQYFHYPKNTEEDIEKKKQVDKFIAEAKKSANITDLLCTLDPVITIPPYEDQNNRRPPIDQTLLLSPLALDRQYPQQWEKWALAIMKSDNELNPYLLSGLDEILNLNDRKSRLPSNSEKESVFSVSYTGEKLKHCYYLQRLLDLTRVDNSPLSRIRKWALEEKTREYETNRLITSIIGEKERDTFLEFCRKYYKETSLSQKGLWSICKSPLMEISGIHPCMKKRMLDKLVAGVLNIGTNFDFEKFKKVWISKVEGSRTVKSMCAAIEKTRKDYGNSFNENYKKAKLCQTILRNNKAEHCSFKIPADISKILKLTQKASDFIGHELSLDESGISKFNNPYSLAQLYTILETETNGFSSTCKAVTLENSYRMQTTEYGKALCCRLPAESVRPFDGSLVKILDRQAYEIAKIKAKELLKCDEIKDQTVKINILVEENCFEFTSSIATIKKTEKAKKLQVATQKETKNTQAKWESKESRIRKDSQDICAYTGVSLNNNTCEIDHIIPRSETLYSYGTIFNSEFNLIRVSQEGNQKKKESRYTLDNLADNYLKKIFETSSRDEIRKKIRETIKELIETNPFLNVDLMTDIERQCCRHALFLRPSEEAFKTVIDAISKQGRTIVNGTQAWFVKTIVFKIKEFLKEWKNSHNVNIEFNAFKISATDNHNVRMYLGQSHQELSKKEIQPITSHAIDALCMFSTASCIPRISDEISIKNGQMKLLSEIENLYKIVPDNYEIIRIKSKDFIDKKEPASKPLFKDTIYGENFLNIMVKDSTVKIGFDWNENCVELISGGTDLLKILNTYLHTKTNSKSPVITYRINKTKAFELFSKYFNNNVSSEENVIYQCLKALHYTTLHRNIAEVLYDESKKTFNKIDDIMKKINKGIAVGNFPKMLKIKLNNTSKTLALPAKNEWQKIINEFTDLLGKKDQTGKGKDRLDTLVRKHLTASSSSKLAHKKCSRIYSLPLVDNPSGGIRIKRINDEKEPVYQLVAANTPVTSISKGFESDETGNVQWSKSIPTEAYTNGNLTILDTQRTSCKHYVKMNEDRLVFASDAPYLKIYIKPSSVDRRKVIIEQEFSDFIKCLGSNPNYRSYHDLPSVITLENASNISSINSLCGKPRGGKIELLSIGKIIKYSYSQESSGIKVNHSYNTQIDKDINSNY